MNIILDRFSLLNILIIFLKYKNANIFLLDKQNKTFLSCLSVLFKLRKVNISEFKQKISDLKINDENLFDYIHVISKQEAYNEAEEILNDEKKFASINETYKKNSIKLFIIKLLDKEYRLYLKKVFYSLSILKKEEKIFFFEKPKFINLDKFFEKKKLNYFFYNCTENFLDKKFILSSLVGINLRNYLKKILGLIGNIKSLNIYLENKNNLTNILCLTENNFSNHQNLRKFPSWKKQNNYNIIAYDQSNLLLKESFIKNKSYLQNIFYFEIDVINKIIRFLKNDSFNNQIILAQKDLAKFNFLKKRYKNISKEIIIFFNEVQIILALSNYFKIKLFISSQTHLSLNLAAEIVSQYLNFETINFQYSFAHTKSHSLVLLSNADNLLLFSDKFKHKFSDKNIYSSKVYEIGYIFKPTEEIKINSNKLRDSLKKNGSKFIISYFDEGVKFDKWKLSHKDLILNDLKKLLGFVLKNPEFGLIVKPQFAFHKPSKIFKDEIFVKGIRTGRYIEAVEGSYRNNILPFETALASNLSIGYYFGGTACLESSLIDTPTVMLNPFKNKGDLDNIIDKENVLFKDIDEIIKILNNLKNNPGNIQKYKKFNNIIYLSNLLNLVNTESFESIIAKKINVRTNKIFNP